MISIDALGVEFSGTTLFSDVSFVINENDKIALMGKNGAGKSTLLKILSGISKPTSGSISAPKDFIISYLPQHLLTEDNATVFEETSKAFASIFAMRDEIEVLNTELTVRTDYDSDDYYKIIEKVSELSEKYYSIEEINYEAEVEKVLVGIGFLRSDFTRPTSEFSGGWRMRIELAKILLQKPDLILLDEPTNHMDIESIQWLEDFLVNSAKAVVVISHDRTFINNITTRTIEVTMGRIYDYKVNYSRYLDGRKPNQPPATLLDYFPETYTTKLKTEDGNTLFITSSSILEFTIEGNVEEYLKTDSIGRVGKVYFNSTFLLEKVHNH
jgi:ATP-binding cassette subfamily F protein 3